MWTELVCRVWHAVQVPIVPSLFGLPTLWHCSHPLVIADAPFHLHKGRPACSPWLIGFRKIDLLRSKSLVAVDRGPRGCRMATAQKLLGRCFSWHPRQLLAVKLVEMMNP